MPIDRRTLLAWVATVLVLVLCLMPKRVTSAHGESLPALPHMDKAIHFGLFAVFGLLWARAGGTRGPSSTRVAAVLVAVFAMAVGTELLQGLPQIDRDPDPFDALADVVGGTASVGVVVALKMLGRRPEPTGEAEC